MNLSKEAVEFLSNKEVIDQKVELLNLVFEYLSQHGKSLQNNYASSFPTSLPPKVSRGENYKGYPFMVLDYPRIFSSEQVMACRHLFWWGHFFSCTLHLKGDYLKRYRLIIPSIIETIQEEGLELKVAFSGDEWNHDLNAPEYLSSQDFQLGKVLSFQNIPYLKLSLQIPLNEFNNLETFLKDFENLILKKLK